MYLNLIFGAKSSRFQLQKLKKKKKKKYSRIKSKAIKLFISF